MKRVFIIFLFTFILIVNIYGQTNITNNSTITINGSIYYFRPATTPSSPPPTKAQTDFISEGSWYGEDAARAWASVSDWAIENCQTTTDPVVGRNGERVYIHQVHAYKKGTNGAIKYIHSSFTKDDRYYTAGISIYYWVVPANTTMENGIRKARIFWFK